MKRTNKINGVLCTFDSTVHRMILIYSHFGENNGKESRKNKKRKHTTKWVFAGRHRPTTNPPILNCLYGKQAVCLVYLSQWSCVITLPLNSL